MMDANGGARSSHKTMRQRLERVESSLNAVPPAMEEALEGLEAHCTAGIKLASLLETVLQDSPLLLLALRYKEVCETLLDKTSRAALTMKGELVAPVKRLGPTVSRLRSHIDSHAKASSRHESCVKQLEGVTMSSSASRNKQGLVEAKFRSSAQEFAQEDKQLVLATTEFSQMRTELMGGCFLGYLEVVSRVLESASDLLAPLGAHKDIRHDLQDSPASSVMKEATVSWLAATQVNQSLRSFGGLSRNDVQCMLYQHPDGLPDTIRSGLNSKVDHLLKLYRTELTRVETPHHVVTGGFHFNPKAIELALKDCCSELEAKGAGADHAHTTESKAEQISCDVPRTTYVVGRQRFGAATGEHAAANIAEKKAAIRRLLESLLADSTHQSSLLDDYAQHVLNESCTTVTNTTAKTAVQLVFGKANLVLVRPSPASEDNKPIQITAQKHDSTLTITVHSSWWLVEDYAAFAVLERPVDPSSSLGVVDACYSITLSLENYSSDSPCLELPTVSVTYRQPPCPSPSPSLATSPPRQLVSSKEKEKLLGSFTILREKFRNISQKTRGKIGGAATLRTYVDIEGSGEKEEEDERRQSKTSSDSEALFSAPGRYPLSGRSDSIGRGVKPSYHHHGGVRRSGSDETISSQSTLVPHTSLLESDNNPLGIADLIHAQPTLTQSRIRAHDKYRHQGYRGYRRKENKVGDEEEEGKDDDRTTLQGSPDISIASEMEIERVFSLLSTKNPLDFELDHKRGYQQENKEGYDGCHGDDKNYNSDYGYDPQEYLGSGEGERRREGERRGEYREGERRREYGEGERRGEYREGERRGEYGEGERRGEYGEGERRGEYREGERRGEYGEEEQKERDTSSSSSSGIEDQYGRRSRSGSASSLHREVDGEGAGGHRGGSSASLRSADSGIGGAAHRMQGGQGSHSQNLPFDFSQGLGSLIHHNYDYFDMERRDRPPPAVSSSSSGGSSPVMFRTRSEENIRLPERSASRSSTHSMPPGALQGHGSTHSLNDFDHTPGSRPRPFNYDNHLSQGSVEEPLYWDYQLHKPPPEHFNRPPYNYNIPPGGPHDGPYNYSGGYGEPPPERHSRPMQRVIREDFSPSPGPLPLDHRHQPHPYWQHGPGFEQPLGGPPPQMHPPQIPPPHPPRPAGPPGPPGSRMHPPGPPPMHDNRFQPVQFRPITHTSPSPASIHSMSPAPSPHPTPPPTPPPHGPLRPPPPHGPPPAPYHSPGPRGHMHPPQEYCPPPPPQMGPPHGYQGPMPPREPNFGPPRFGPPPGPPISAPGRFPPAPLWDHGGWGH